MYILNINYSFYKSFANIFSQSVGSLFALSIVSFAVQKIFSLIQSYLFIFAFVFLVWGDISQKITKRNVKECTVCQKVSSLFVKECLLLEGLWFQFYIFNSFLIYFCAWCEKVVQAWFFYMELYNFPNTIYWRGCLFLTVYSCLYCHRFFNYPYKCELIWICLLFELQEYFLYSEYKSFIAYVFCKYFLPVWPSL